MKLIIKIILLMVWVSQVYGQSEDRQPPCPATAMPTGSISSDEQAEVIIATNCEIGSGATVIFKAENSIVLNPRFKADASNGSVFEAIIGVCNHNRSGEKAGASAQNELALQNIPNPFTEQTTITFTLTKDVPVTLLVYDSMGREIATLLNTELMTTGTHETTFDGTDYSSGVYYYTIQAGDFFGTQKMILTK